MLSQRFGWTYSIISIVMVALIAVSGLSGSSFAQTRSFEFDLGDGQLRFDFNVPPTFGPTHAPQVIGESGVINVIQDSRRQWHTVRLRQSYDNPVVIMGPVSMNGSDPAFPRVRRVRNDRFQFKIDEWRNLDGRHRSETIGYLVVEAGQHVLPGGTRLAAGVTSADHTFRRQQLGGQFSQVPIVLSQVMSDNGGDPVVTRHRRVTPRGFLVRVQEDEGGGTHARENIAWVAIEPSRTIPDSRLIQAAFAPSGVSDEATIIGVPRITPRRLGLVFLAAMQTTQGLDPAALRYDRRRGGIVIRVEEDQVGDREQDHTPERVGYAIFGQGFLRTGASGPVVEAPRPFPPGPPRGFPPPRRPGDPFIGETNFVTVEQRGRGQWHGVRFERPLDNPVVVMGPVSNQGAHEAFPRIRRVTSNGFEFRVDEWAYRDGAHVPERVGYLAIEAGTHVLDDGRRVQAGRTTVDDSWGQVAYRRGFGDQPIVLSQVESLNGRDPVVTRHRNVTSNGFQVRLQEEEAGGPHQNERVAWIAFDAGETAFSRSEGALINARWVSSTEGVNAIRIGSRRLGADPRNSVFLAAIQTFQGPDPVSLWFQPDPGGILLGVEEEQSADPEVVHSRERIGYAVLRPGVIERGERF